MPARSLEQQRDDALAYAHAMELLVLSHLGDSAKRDEKIRARIAEARRKYHIAANPPAILRKVAP